MHSNAIEAIARGLCDNSPYNDDTWQDYVPEATAALDAYHAHLEAEGFVMVPVEPTQDMILAFFEEIGIASGYRAMLSARPNVKG